MISKHMAPYMEGNKTVRAMFELGKNLAAEIGAENVYDFSLGNPNVNPPEAVKQAIIDILNTEDPHVVHGYMSNAGFDLTRQAIADNLNQRFGGEGAHYAAKNIVMETGAAYALNVVLRTILDDEDEIITFAPYFLEYANYVRNYNGKTVAVPQSPETGFQPNLDAFEKLITPRTKGVIINNPNNPTGVIYTEETMTKLAAI
ncbi:MAG TPA: pyridoxal phosphate-dependent aminotransferase, partial [Eubacterium sp.]|nr:pyridoxal phosphate-dependent aminotransferase [Eubacterium sp.]